VGIVTVHTSGINWDGILATVAALTVILTPILTVAGSMIVRSIKRATKDEITSVIDAKVTPTLDEIRRDLRRHDTRIARLEGIDEGKRLAVAQAHTTSTDIAKEVS
jgi:hypothetical protein